MTVAPAATADPRAVLGANAICFASMLAWAAGLYAADPLVRLVPAIPLTALRIGVAGIAMGLIWWGMEGRAALARADWARGLPIGAVTFSVGAVLLAVAQARTDAVTVSIITASMPVIGLALEVALDGRRITGAFVLGLLLSLAGGLVALASRGLTLDLGLGALAALGSCLAFTWGSRATVVHLPAMTPLGRTSITVLGGTLGGLAFAAAWWAIGGAGVPWASVGGAEAGALLLYGLAGIALSQILWIVAVERIGVANAALHMNAVPFLVMLLAFAFGAAWDWARAGGAAVVVLGVLVAQGLIRPPAR